MIVHQSVYVCVLCVAFRKFIYRPTRHTESREGEREREREKESRRTVYKEHESLVGDTGHVDSSTRVGRSVVPLGREDLQTSRLSDEVMRIGLGRQTNSVLSPRDLRARVPGHVTFEYRRLTGCDRDFTGRLTDHWSHWMTTDGHACKYTHTHTHTEVLWCYVGHQ